MNISSYFTAGQFILDEDSNSSTFAGDAELYAFQIGVNPVVYTPLFERPTDLLSAVSYYSYNDYATNSNFTIGGVSLARGNPNVVGAAGDLDTQDFEVIEVYNELAFYPGGLPVRPYFDWARNLNSDFGDDEPQTATSVAAIGKGEETAWAVGTKFGGIVKKGDWEASVAYKRIHANSVPGFNDSDFGFAGHSGKRGGVFKFGYALTDSVTLNSAAFFVNNLNTGTGGVLDEEQRRFQFDLAWKF